MSDVEVKAGQVWEALPDTVGPERLRITSTDPAEYAIVRTELGAHRTFDFADIRESYRLIRDEHGNEVGK